MTTGDKDIHLNAWVACNGIVGWLRRIDGVQQDPPMISMSLLAERQQQWVMLPLDAGEARATAAKLNQYADMLDSYAAGTAEQQQKTVMIPVVGGPRDGDEVAAMGSEIVLAEPTPALSEPEWMGLDMPKKPVMHRYRINESGTKYIHMCCRAGEPGLNT